jgi:hypothetical protein
VAQRALLDAAADLVDDLVGQLHAMKRVEDPDHVGQRGGQRGRIPTKRIQCGEADPGPPGLVAVAEPVGVDLAGAARHHVEQPSRPVRGQVGDAGGEAGAALRPGVLPDVLVDS